MLINALFTLWVARAVLALLPPLWWWQVKEYRWDRFWAAWKEGEGRGIFVGRLWIGRAALFGMLLVLWPLLTDPDPFYGLVAILLYIVDTAWTTLKALSRRLAVPVFTGRLSLSFLGAFLTLLSAGLLLIVVSQSLPAFVLALILLDISLPFVASGWVGLVTPLSWLARRRVIEHAKYVRSAHPGLIVVGITGSHGKTSTKEFASQLLSGRFSVFKTHEHENSEIAVARRLIKVCSELKAKSYKPAAVFIAEMGAYRKGEIKTLAEMVQPKIGVLTGLTDQHLALFGSRENILNTKWELAESLPDDGTLIINADVPEFVERARNFRGRVISYGLKEGAEFRAANIREERDRISATINIGGETADVSAPLLGAFQLSNVLAAMSVAHALDMKLEEITARLSALRPLPKTMEPHRGRKGSVIIDDSYSANPEGVIAAIRVLRRFPGKKMIIMPSLIELGPRREEAHRRIARELAELPIDLGILTDKRAFSFLIEGFRSAGGNSERLVFAESPAEILGHIRALLNESSVVLLAGRITARLYQALSKELFL